jgi:uncharacterized protein YegL
MSVPTSPPPSAGSDHAILTVILMDASSSIRSSGLLGGLIEAANEMLLQLQHADCLVSLVYFNRDLGVPAWRRKARELPAFSTTNVPIDGGTRLFDAITTTIDRLEQEFLASHGETNADVRLLIFTDGVDTRSTATGMDARPALGRAQERGFSITFVSSVPGLASDLGLAERQTLVIAATKQGIQDGFKRATQQITADLVRLPDAMPGRRPQQEIPRQPPAASGATPPAVDSGAAAPPAQPGPRPAQRPPARRPWWRFW